MATLDSVLRALPAPPATVPQLPVAHMTFASRLPAIAQDGALRTTPCPVFGSRLLYLFYGCLAYRTQDGSTRDSRKAPVAFLFEPSILTTSRVRYYPFDTGAAAYGFYGTAFAPLEPDFKSRLKILGRKDPAVPSKFAHHAFGSIQNYLTLSPDGSGHAHPSPFPELCDFYSTDLTPTVDERQGRIEVQVLHKLPLPRGLIFMGFPRSLYPEFRRICKAVKATYVPDHWCYPDRAVLRPNDLAAQLAAKCDEVVERYLTLEETAC